ncbi:MAG: cation-translocating P-type ATPase [Magnetospirillum sp.]|nr:cation-translocating P-type ATPase [Magnetospirillum sp.]
MAIRIDEATGPFTTLIGLSAAEARGRLLADGPNDLPKTDRRTVWRIVRETLSEPMLALLLTGGAIYLAIGNATEGGVLIAFAAISVTITLIQEIRTERVLEALQALASPRALVIRDGAHVRIAGREVVCGDILFVATGDRVAADAIVVDGPDLRADESLLTGESVPVAKRERSKGTNDGPARPGGDGLSVVFAGSLIVAGQAICEVVATGRHSEIGRIGASLAGLETEPPRLRTQTRRAVAIFAAIGLSVSLAVFVLSGRASGDWLDAGLAAIAVGMSLLPEEFPIVLTVFMAMGAWRISRARVLTRKAAAIETLGSATCLCTDKTGTLTENRMRVAELRAPGAFTWRHETAGTPAPPLRDLIATATRACLASSGDPMERAIRELDDAWRKGTAVDLAMPVKAYGLHPDLLAVTQIWPAAGAEYVAAAKGAPEAITRLCRMDGAAREELERDLGAMANRGLRILGVARTTWHSSIFPDSPVDFPFEFVGLIGLADPLRAGVREAIDECRDAGIAVAMITGDHPATAMAIARAADLRPREAIVGADLDGMDDARIARAAREGCVFARIMPAQKLRIVQALKADRQIVAMTGDGVNDAPALKSAHIGIAMGGRGTDVAREASAIVLLDDDFASIVKAIRLGRRIHDNLLKAIAFIVAVHVPIAGLALLPPLWGAPPVLGPLHVALLEMAIDPVCALLFEAEPEEKNVMDRPPYDPDAPLFSLRLLAWSAAQGLIGLAAVGAVYAGGLWRGMPATELRALAFATLFAVVVSLVLANRSFSPSIRIAILAPNSALLPILAFDVAALGVALSVPTLAGLLGFGPLLAYDMALVAASGLAVFLVLQAAKWAPIGPKGKLSA